MITTLNFKFISDGNTVMGKRIMVTGHKNDEDKFYPVLESSISNFKIGLNDNNCDGKIYDSLSFYEDCPEKERKFERTFFNAKLIKVTTTETDYDNGFEEVVKSVELEFEDEF